MLTRYSKLLGMFLYVQKIVRAYWKPHCASTYRTKRDLEREISRARVTLNEMMRSVDEAPTFKGAEAAFKAQVRSLATAATHIGPGGARAGWDGCSWRRR
jgi:hypothetical protein